ncbi:MAG TPA: efflux RND transporter periplasmic adaptor subunit [Vicinamibacterales bacterium]|nr:efflux RND transporter periplasmic adaptor subunit [Vicinamibacterales bacterium]
MAASLSFSACGGSAPPPPPSPAQSSAAAAAADGPFTVPPDQLAHLKVAPVEAAVWTTTVRTTGTVDWDNDHTTQAITQVSGPIARLLVDTGTRVKAGDPLLSVASADLTTAISAYRKAKNRFDLAQRSLDRSKDLLAHKAIAPRDMENAEADYNDASTDLQTSLQALKIYGVSQDDITDAERQNAGIKPELVMRAPLSGTIVQKLVLPGQFIQAGTTVAFMISNTDTVWVQGHVYDKDLASIHVGDKVDERNSSFPQTFHGTVSYIGDMLDPATRTTPVRIVTQSIDGLLKKDIFLDVVIHDKSTMNVLAVPTAGVLYDEQNFPFVYIQVAPGRFAERRVTLGSQQDSQTQVTAGLKEGDQVVSDGSLFLQFGNTYQQ